MAILTPERKRNLSVVRQMILKTLDVMIKETNQPRVKALYYAVKQNVEVLPINFRSGQNLEQGLGFSTMGENIKRLGPFGNIQSAIILPEEHVFSGNQLTYDGVLTLLHEYSHVILPNDSKYFALELFGSDGSDVAPDEIDEFFADLMMSRIAARLVLLDFAVTGY